MWTEGYVSGIDYTHGYYSELSPARLKFAALSAGYDVSASSPGKPFHYLELGYGQGLSVNIHAAATTGRLWAADFNHTHAANAQSLAEASWAELRALDHSFQALVARTGLQVSDTHLTMPTTPYV